jgi:hypothetical protein
MCFSIQSTQNDITSRYANLQSAVSPPSFYLGCHYQQSNDNKWKIGTKSYVEECMKRVIDLLGIIG